MATLTVNMDDALKEDFIQFCKEVGLNASVAVSMFAKATVRQNRIPFEITGDPLYSESNRAVLEKSIAELASGEYADVAAGDFFAFVEEL
jgi:DNA-damage-inducible protein J